MSKEISKTKSSSMKGYKSSEVSLSILKSEVRKRKKRQIWDYAKTEKSIFLRFTTTSSRQRNIR